MKEKFIQFVWQHQLLNKNDLLCTNGKSLKVQFPGNVNNGQGPDFTNALLEIDDVLWAGNVEIHLSASDWFAHQHHLDTHYSNVILHVVLVDDVDIYDSNQQVIPTLEIKNFIHPTAIATYERFVNMSVLLPCKDEMAKISPLFKTIWMDALYVERLERKVHDVGQLFMSCHKNYEYLLFVMMFKYFGGPQNEVVFEMLVKDVGFEVLQKIINAKQLDAFLFGKIGLLMQESDHPYLISLVNEYQFMKHKYKWEEESVYRLNFYGVRPVNYPTVKIAQFSSLYHHYQKLFGFILASELKFEVFKAMFRVKCNDFWDDHFTLYKKSKKSDKTLSDAFTVRLIINVIVPVLAFYYQERGMPLEDLVDFIHQLPKEENTIVKQYEKLGLKSHSALHTQALLTLNKEYCALKKCETCKLGAQILLNKV